VISSGVTVAAPPAASSSSSENPARLVGKFTANSILFASRDVGLVTITGFVGDSAVVSSWQERTTDGGRRWKAGPVAHTSDGRYPAPTPSTQSGLAFVSASTGWAYQPSLFYTRNGGLTWAPAPGRPAAVGPVATQGSTTWVTGYPCRSFDCAPKILQTDRVGGALLPLPSQPVSSGPITTLLRPTPSIAWTLSEVGRGHQQLSITVDAGHSWHQVRGPCEPSDTMSVAGNQASGLYVQCVARSQSMCGVCVTPVLYRAVDNGASWARRTVTPTPPYSSTTASLFVQPVAASTMWAVNQPPAGSSTVLRSIDGGRDWSRVLQGPPARPLAIHTLLATDALHAWAVVMTDSKANGIEFEVYRTSNGGRSWNKAALPIPTNLH
jgi:hypothetical protein